MQFFVGIDGGGTRTRAFVVDEAGLRTGYGEVGLSNPNHATPEELRTNIGRAIRAACQQAKAELPDCVSIFFGMAGITSEVGRQMFRDLAGDIGLGHARADADHDIRTALAGGLAGQPGIALIVGTGSSCYGRAADGRTWQTGGWESLISDEGSGFYLGREAISLAARMSDGREPETPLRGRVFGWLGIQHLADLLPRLHMQGMSRTEIAAFAPQVIELANQGDSAAMALLDRGAVLLAELVAANHRMLSRTGPMPPDVVIVGGLGTARTIYRDKIRAAIVHALPGVRIHEPLLIPAVGAALLAMHGAGQPVSSQLIENLKTFSP